MSFAVFAQCNEFAVSTGRNVNSGPGISAFDATVPFDGNLRIAPIFGAEQASGFLPGDRYALSFSGKNTTSIHCAVVVRCDPLGKEARAVVFEGANTRGALLQMVWSPRFDLTAWRASHAQSGRTPGFYNRALTQEANSGVSFARDTLVDTPSGPCPVRQLSQGDMVLTRDGGATPVQAVVAAPVLGVGSGAPVTIHCGVLGTYAPVRVSSQHRVLVSDPRCEPIFGVRDVLVAAGDLVDGVKIQRHTASREMRYHILLDRHEILSCQGLRCESVLLGDQRSCGMEQAYHRPDAAFCQHRSYKPARRILTRDEATLIKPLLGLETADMSVKPPRLLFAA